MSHRSPGRLVIGNGVGGAGADVVKLLANDQLNSLAANTIAVENAQVQRQQGENKENETAPNPDHAKTLPFPARKKRR